MESKLNLLKTKT